MRFVTAKPTLGKPEAAIPQPKQRRKRPTKAALQALVDHFNKRPKAVKS